VGVPFEVRFSFGVLAPRVQRINLYLFEEDGESPRWIGGFMVVQGKAYCPAFVTCVSRTSVIREGDTFAFLVHLLVPGTVRAVVLYTDEGFWGFGDDFEDDDHRWRRGHRGGVAVLTPGLPLRPPRCRRPGVPRMRLPRRFG
jgi:hypothetical protein